MAVILRESTPSFQDIVALTKPKITLMTMFVAGGGMLLSSGELSVAKSMIVLIGIAFLVSGSSAFNMYWERDFDALMLRTRNRPLPSGRMQPFWALSVGWLFSFLALPILLLASNVLTTLLGFFSLVAYILIYTPMKRMSCLALIVGAVPGAMPALMGYTAASGKLDSKGLALFGLAFVWQLPHFIAISIFRKDEYAQAGYPVVAQVTSVFVAKILIAITSVLIIASSLSLFFIGLGGTFYCFCSVFLGFWFLIEVSLGFFTNDVDAWSKRVFYASLFYQLFLFMALGIDVLMSRGVCSWLN
jgi:heme o synthase